MQLFYDPNLKRGTPEFALHKEESHHLVKVLRKKAGDKVFLTNGKGYLFTGILQQANAENCILKITDSRQLHPKRHRLHLAVAPTKNITRFEWFLEKATEIGIDEITPLICQRSERKVIKEPRLEKVILSAMKQSFRTYLPRLNKPMLFKEFVEKDHKDLLFIAHCANGEKADFKRRVAADRDVTMLIGPEGDFTEEEIKLARENSFIDVSLGEARLRTETAAIVACTTVAVINGT